MTETKNKKFGFTPTPILKRANAFLTRLNFLSLFNSEIRKSVGIGVSFAKAKRGFTLLEVVIASSIMTTGLLAILNAYSFFIRAEKSNIQRVKSIYLLGEGIEASRFLRDKGWTANISSLSTTTSYYLYFSTSTGSGTWQTTTTAQLYDGIFSRTAVFGEVYRNNSTNNISTTSSGSTIDKNTRKITIQVSWSDSIGSTTKSLSAYLTNLGGN
jgi:prepilin-type N-terminal cleavage/methylation domain-containing protein